MNLRWAFACLIILMSWPSEGYTAPDLPEHFIDDTGHVCIKKLALDGCNTCTLDRYSGQWGWACTELGCLNPEKAGGQECFKSLALSAFEIPPLDNTLLKNCKTALLKDRMCGLEFSGEGFSWDCTKKKSQAIDLNKPLCVRTADEKLINQDIVEDLMQKQKEHNDRVYKQKRDAEKICIQFEDQCNRIFPIIFPSQTNQKLAYGHLKSDKFSQEKMRKCRTENRKRKKKCVHEIKRGNLPKINYDGDRHWLSRNKGIQLEDTCVRYENECFAYYIALGKTRDGLKWTWRPIQKNCPMEEFKNGGNAKPMSCASLYEDAY